MFELKKIEGNEGKENKEMKIFQSNNWMKGEENRKKRIGGEKSLTCTKQILSTLERVGRKTQ